MKHLKCLMKVILTIPVIILWNILWILTTIFVAFPTEILYASGCVQDEEDDVAIRIYDWADGLMDRWKDL